MAVTKKASAKPLQRAKDKHILDVDSVKFLIAARQKTNAIAQLQEVLTAPRNFAKRYSLKLTANVEQRLKKLGEYNRSFNFSPDDPVNQEVFRFYNAVVIDGRYIARWTKDPAGVAKLLKRPVSDEVTKRILDMRFPDVIDTRLINEPGQLGIFWIVVVIVVIVLVFIPSCSAYNFSEIVADPRSAEKV